MVIGVANNQLVTFGSVISFFGITVCVFCIFLKNDKPIFFQDLRKKHVFIKLHCNPAFKWLACTVVKKSRLCL